MHKKDAIREAQVQFFGMRVPAASPLFFRTPRRFAPPSCNCKQNVASNFQNVADRCIAGRFWADLATVVGCTGKKSSATAEFWGPCTGA